MFFPGIRGVAIAAMLHDTEPDPNSNDLAYLTAEVEAGRLVECGDASYAVTGLDLWREHRGQVYEDLAEPMRAARAEVARANGFEVEEQEPGSFILWPRPFDPTEQDPT